MNMTEAEFREHLEKAFDDGCKTTLDAVASFVAGVRAKVDPTPAPQARAGESEGAGE